MRILVVDDNHALLGIIPRQIEFCLTALGIKNAEIIPCDNAKSARHLIGTLNPPFDIVVTDFQIPSGCEGLDIANDAKEVADQKGTQTFVVGISGISPEEKGFGTENWRIDYRMTKPYTMAQITEWLEIAIENKKQFAPLAA